MDTPPTAPKAPTPTTSKEDSYWNHLKEGAPILLAGVTALGVSAGWAYYYGLYSVHFRVRLSEVPLSLIDYLVAGLLPTGIVGFMFFVSIRFVLEREDWMRRFVSGYAHRLGKRKGRPLRLRQFLTIAFDAAAGVGALIYFTQLASVNYVLLCLLYVGSFVGVLVAFGGRFYSWRLLRWSALGLLTSMAAILATVFGNAAAKSLHSGRSDTNATVTVSDKAIAETIKDKSLKLIIHATGVWYFCDGDTDWRSPTMYALPDSVVTSVVLTKRKD